MQPNIPHTDAPQEVEHTPPEFKVKYESQNPYFPLFPCSIFPDKIV